MSLALLVFDANRAISHMTYVRMSLSWMTIAAVAALFCPLCWIRHPRHNVRKQNQDLLQRLRNDPKAT